MKSKILAIAFASLLPAVAAADIEYSWVQVQASTGDFSANFAPTTYDAAAIALGASFGIGDHFFIQLDQDAVVADDGFDFMVSGLAASFGFHFGLGDSADLYIKGGMRQSTVEDDTAEFADDSGTELGAGLRIKPGDMFEFNARYSQADLGSVGSRDVMGVGAVIMFGDHFGLLLDYSQTSYSDFVVPGFEADIDLYTAGFRFAW